MDDIDQSQDIDDQDNGDDQPVDITTVDDLVPLRVQELREEAERDRARALLAETVEAKEGFQQSFRVLEARAVEIEEWGALEADDPLLPDTEIIREIARRDAIAAEEQAEADRVARLSEEERQAEVAALAAAAAEAKDHAERVAAVEALATADKIKAINPRTGRIELVSADGHPTAAEEPILALMHELDNTPVPDRDKWWTQRSTLEVDGLSVLLGVHAPIDIENVPALAEGGADAK
jgi:hypothetical protein